MKGELSKEKALAKAEHICSRQEKCRADIRQKLYDWKVNPDYHNWILDSLVKNRFIDEERYTGFFVKDKFRLNKWGRIKIEYALRNKQIAEEIIQKNLEQINEEEYNAMCKALIIKKKQTLKEDDVMKLKEKLLRFGQSRGFEASLVLKVVEKTLEGN